MCPQAQAPYPEADCGQDEKTFDNSADSQAGTIDKLQLTEQINALNACGEMLQRKYSPLRLQSRPEAASR